MSSHRSRNYSPSRHYNDQPRNSTGAVYVTSFDTSTRGGSPSQPRASVSGASSSRPNVTYEAQPMRKSTTTDGKTKTEYAIRPRNDSYAPPENKRPLTVSTRNLSPTRRGLSVASPREMTPTVVRDDSSRLLQPMSPYKYNNSQHQRHNSTSQADSDPRGTARARRERAYHSRGPSVQKAYHDSRPPLRNADDEGWSYTGPREQFHRDYPQNAPGRQEDISRRERPASYYESERPVGKRDNETPIYPARQSGKIDRAEPNRYGSRSGFDSDPDRASEAPKRRNSTRQPVVHQQQYRDDGYSSARDDYESKAPSKYRPVKYDDDTRPKERYRDSGRESERERDYERKYHRDTDRDRDRERDRDRLRDYERDDRAQDSRRKQRSRENSPERSSSGLKSLATGALSSLAAAGVLKGATGRENKERDDASEDDDHRERRPRKHRHRSRRDDDYDDAGIEDDRRRDERRRSRNPDVSTSDSSEDHPSRRQNARRRHRDDNDDQHGTEEKTASGDGRPERASSRARTRDRDEPDVETDRSSRDVVAYNRQDGESENLETRTMSPGENGDDRPRRVQLVEPVREKDEFKPKGILKPARQVPFPEDPNPVREGVAPLKDATKDGIPPNARWTKINRLLVNPEALEKAHERFEEREDYVIVLRVISREEIQKLAEKTKEIRDARELEWQRKLEDRRRRKNDRSSDTTVSEQGDHYGYDSNTEQKPQLAIEAPPAAPAADLYGLQSQQNSHVPGRSMAGGAPIPDINVQSSYSQNV